MQTTTPALLTIEPLSGACDHAAMLVAGSDDQTVTDTTYLPVGFDGVQAAEFAAGLAGRSWIFRVDGAAAGLASVSPVSDIAGVELPADAVEIDAWLLEQYRGRGFARAAWLLLAAKLAPVSVVSVIWESNTASLRRIASLGGVLVGRTFYRDAASAGWCAVYVSRFG